MKSVCIIGAGPAGLVAAKTFIQKGGYSVTIFEAAGRVGGMWRAQPGELGDKCDPEMRTNLSRFTVAFSDLSWSSVDLTDPSTGATPTASVPLFPRAWQVGRYLDAYAHKFGVDSHTVFNHRVISAAPSEDFTSWEICAVDTTTKQSTKFGCHYLVVASGFFSTPIDAKHAPEIRNSPNFQHSSQFRGIDCFKPGKIAVIGGGISGSDAAAQAALLISSQKYSPGTPKPPHANSKVYHITNRPFYCLPRYLPLDPHCTTQSGYKLAPKFLPNDLALYSLSRRGEENISAAITTVPPEKAKKGHAFLRSLIGGDQSDLGFPELVYRQEHTCYPGYTGITDTYSEFVRSGIIVPVQGWVEQIEQSEVPCTFAITLAPKAPWRLHAESTAKDSSIISDVGGIVEATGYETDLAFLDDRVKELLGYDSLCSRIPLLLTRGSIFATEVPTIAFVGFYEGPFWSVMELQARIIADSWMGTNNLEMRPAPEGELHGHNNDAQQMRKAVKERSLQVPQFWMADYVGLVEEMARKSGTARDDAAFGGPIGPVFPSRYQDFAANAEAGTVVKEVVEIMKSSNEQAKYVAIAVFRAMQGIWTMNRTITSRSSISLGGTFTGTAHFHPRAPTNPTYSAEYLYIETGIFTMANGYSVPATRRYIYRYNEMTDKITAWFADEDNESAGAIFNTWNFYKPDDAGHGWMAKGHHWCDPDTYQNTCEFQFRGAALQKFMIEYEVEGPRKSYQAESWYERPET